MMPKNRKSEKLFYKYFDEWVDLYKEGAVREVTLKKYYRTGSWIRTLSPELKLSQLDRKSYQMIINAYAKTHEKQTVIDFHQHLRSSLLDALEEGIIRIDPTRKVALKGKEPREKKAKFLSQSEVKRLIKVLDLGTHISWDHLILLLLKTGIRFSECLALTPADFDFNNQILTITKTWNYKHPDGGFMPTKNFASIRKIPLDRKTSLKFAKLIKDLEFNQPIFSGKRVFNSVVNRRLRILCETAGVPVISLHSCRHTHASLLIFAGVSVASIARRLGHSTVTTTQETYLHIIKELEVQDTEKILKHLASL